MDSDGHYGSPKIREKMKTEQILHAMPSIKRIKKITNVIDHTIEKVIHMIMLLLNHFMQS